MMIKKKVSILQHVFEDLPVKFTEHIDLLFNKKAASLLRLVFILGRAKTKIVIPRTIETFNPVIEYLQDIESKYISFISTAFTSEKHKIKSLIKPNGIGFDLLHLAYVINGLKPAVSIDSHVPIDEYGRKYKSCNQELISLVSSDEFKRFFPLINVSKCELSLFEYKMTSYLVSGTSINPAVRHYCSKHSFFGFKHVVFDLDDAVDKVDIFLQYKNIQSKIKNCMFDNALRGFVYGFNDKEIKTFLETYLKVKILKKYPSLINIELFLFPTLFPSSEDVIKEAHKFFNLE